LSPRPRNGGRGGTRCTCGSSEHAFVLFALTPPGTPSPLPPGSRVVHRRRPKHRGCPRRLQQHCDGVRADVRSLHAPSPPFPPSHTPCLIARRVPPRPSASRRVPPTWFPASPARLQLLPLPKAWSALLSPRVPDQPLPSPPSPAHYLHTPLAVPGGRLRRYVPSVLRPTCSACSPGCAFHTRFSACPPHIEHPLRPPSNYPPTHPFLPPLTTRRNTNGTQGGRENALHVW
jgi:hypothetical protein